jgi:polyisoprenoid-binding protein YceI
MSNTATASTATTATTAAELTGTWNLDPSHTRIGFTVRHAMVTKVRGQFTDVEGVAVLDAADPSASTASVTIKVPSITTGNDGRDEHLRTGDFFDVERYPSITFRSTGVGQTGTDTFELVGDLTIKDVTRSVAIDFELVGVSQDPFGNTRAGFEGKVVVNRKDFGLEYNAALETGGVLIGEKVTLEFDVSAVKAA